MNYYSIGTTWIEVYMQGGDFSDMTEIAPKSPKNADRRPERTGRLGSFDSGVPVKTDGMHRYPPLRRAIGLSETRKNCLGTYVELGLLNKDQVGGSGVRN